MEKITEKTIFNLIPDKSFVKYAGADYKVAGFTKRVNDWFIEIYDEPPSEHIDLVKAEGCEFVEPSEQKPTEKGAERLYTESQVQEAIEDYNRFTMIRMGHKESLLKALEKLKKLTP